jgi:hypothetical protein
VLLGSGPGVQEGPQGQDPDHRTFLKTLMPALGFQDLPPPGPILLRGPQVGEAQMLEVTGSPRCTFMTFIPVGPGHT